MITRKKMSIIWRTLFAVMLICTIIFTMVACGEESGSSSQTASDTGDGTETTTPDSTTTSGDLGRIIKTSEVDVDGVEGFDGPVAAQILSAGDNDGFGSKDSTVVIGKGPQGHEPVSWTDISLTEEEKQEVRDGKFTAAIAFHYTTDDWYRAQNQALHDTFEDLGIEVVFESDADFNAEKQVSDIETAIQKKPDILVSIPVDETSTQVAYQKAADAGIKIVFMDNCPPDMKAGEDYVSVVSADRYGNGMIAADELAELLNYKGKVGLIWHDADFFVTMQDAAGFVDRMTMKYPDIEIVDRQGFTNAEQVGEIADAMLAKNPDIQGIFPGWDIPAEAVMSSTLAIGKNDLKVTCVGLGDNSARVVAEGGIINQVAAQRPYDQGVTEATLAGYAVIGKESPPYVILPAYKVTDENVVEAYEVVYKKAAPDWLTEIIESKK